jgi:peptidoglycan/LPS O-acetylase OafA/YrhL
VISQTTLNNPKLKRFEALTGLRALAVTLVFIYHNRKYWSGDLHPEIMRLFNEFHVGVSIFFVLSGFLIAYNYGEKVIRNFKDYSKYIIIRMARVLPLYWLILTAYYLDTKFGKLNFSAMTYSLLHGLSNKFNLNAIAQAWSLTVEMSFYIIAPIFFSIKKNHLFYFAIISLGIFAIYFAIGKSWFIANGNPNQFLYPLDFLLNSTMAGRINEFIAGILIAITIKKGKDNFITRFQFKTIAGFSGIFLTLYAIGWFQNDVFKHGYEHPVGRLIFIFILPFFISIFIIGLIQERTKIQKLLSSKFLMLLGNASFAFYLIHISYVNIRIRDLWLGPDRNFILLWAVSIVLYLSFEKPIYNGIRKLVK